MTSEPKASTATRAPMSTTVVVDYQTAGRPVGDYETEIFFIGTTDPAFGDQDPVPSDIGQTLIQLPVRVSVLGRANIQVTPTSVSPAASRSKTTTRGST